MRARDPHAVVPLVLAAGASTRMGSPKLALRFGPGPYTSTTALTRVLDACAALGLATPVVVAGAVPLLALVGHASGRTARFVENQRWADGRTTSIQAGLAALPTEAAAALLWPVDACLASPAAVQALLATWAADPAALACVPSHAGRRGHPLLLDREVFARLTALGPDTPAREVVRALASEGRLRHVESDDPAVLMNLDTPDEYARWRTWDAEREGATGEEREALAATLNACAGERARITFVDGHTELVAVDSCHDGMLYCWYLGHPSDSRPLCKVDLARIASAERLGAGGEPID